MKDIDRKLLDNYYLLRAEDERRDNDERVMRLRDVRAWLYQQKKHQAIESQRKARKRQRLLRTIFLTAIAVLSIGIIW